MLSIPAGCSVNSEASQELHNRTRVSAQVCFEQAEWGTTSCPCSYRAGSCCGLEYLTTWANMHSQASPKCLDAVTAAAASLAALPTTKSSMHTIQANCVMKTFSFEIQAARHNNHAAMYIGALQKVPVKTLHMRIACLQLFPCCASDGLQQWQVHRMDSSTKHKQFDAVHASCCTTNA